MLPEFELLQPRTLDAALGMLAERATDALPIAGGTNVIPDLRDGRSKAAALIDVSRLAELRGIRREDGHVVVGGGTTVAEALRNALIEQNGGPLRQAAAVFANPLTRNRATLGGNLADASPAADMAPPLLALNAEVELASAAGTRCVPLEDFLVGVRRTLRRPDELILALRWPAPAPGSAAAYCKLGLRQADAISVVSVAVSVTVDEAGRCRSARIALGAVAPRPMRAHEAEAALRGRRLGPEAIAEAARLAAEASRPISDIRASASYRKRMVEVLVRRLLIQAASASN